MVARAAGAALLEMMVRYGSLFERNDEETEASGRIYGR